MFKLRGNRVITPILLSGLLAMSGCGKKVDTIEEYGGQTVEQIDAFMKEHKDEKVITELAWEDRL